jgi:hypothetical protein
MSFKRLIMRRSLSALLAACVILSGQGARAELQPPSRGGESVEAVLCSIVERASATTAVPLPFLTRLIWQESSFRADVVSRAGAQGIAQFMPGTARERGLANPFDPEQAIPAAAGLLADLVRRFGNLGLAAAAYNAGPARVSAWLSGKGGLPDETRDYVLRITGRPAEDWSAPPGAVAPEPSSSPQSCLQVTADLRRTGRVGTLAVAAAAPWGVQLAGNFFKDRALASYARAQQLYVAIIGDVQPMIIGSRLRSRGSRPFYRVRVPAQTRAEADALCARIRGARGSCITLRS